MKLTTTEEYGHYVTTIFDGKNSASGSGRSLKESQIQAFKTYLNEFYKSKVIIMTNPLYIQNLERRGRRKKTKI